MGGALPFTPAQERFRRFHALLEWMPNDIPPSGPWRGYYLYGHGGQKHRMRLNLTFTADGKIQGDGVDDVAPFRVHGQFNCGTSTASWRKAYIGMHSVEYSGVYCQQSICGDWSLIRLAGGFWIWPRSLKQSYSAEEQTELEQLFALNIR